MCYIRDRDKGDPCKRSPSRGNCKNRESKTGPGDRSRYPRRTSAFREWRRIQDRENGAERRDLCDQQEFGAGDETGWLWMQSLTNQSPGANSLITGKIQVPRDRSRLAPANFAEPLSRYAHRNNLVASARSFHIVPPLPDDYIHEVIAAFKEINPDYLIPGHWAGERFYDLVRAEMPNKVIRSAVGTRFVFGA
jgi:hypothetical protein